MLSAGIEVRVALTQKGMAMRPHVVVRLGEAEVIDWLVPDSDISLVNAHPQRYADRWAAEKLRAVFGWEDTAEARYGDGS